jgi:hypothetical protein
MEFDQTCCGSVPLAAVMIYYLRGRRRTEEKSIALRNAALEAVS